MVWRGTFLMMIGQVLFLVSGYGINVVLARFLGPKTYGDFGVLYSILMVFELFVVAGIPNALQKFVGESPEQAGKIHGALFRWQLLYTLTVVGLAYLLSAPVVHLLSDDHLLWIFRIACVDIFFFAFYWYFNGLQIGLKNFGRQTLIAATYSLSKFLFISVLVMKGLSLPGAFIGNILGSAAGLAVGLAQPRDRRRSGLENPAPIREFIIANVIYSIALNLFFYVDLWFVKHHMTSEAAGFYTAASTIARIPYFLSIAVSGALLPTLSFAVKNSRMEEVHRITWQVLRMVLMIAVPVAAVVAASADRVAMLFFGPVYRASGSILAILIAGLTLFSLFTILNTIGMAKDGMKACTAIVVTTLAVDYFANWMLVPKFQTLGAAAATTLACAVGVVLSGTYLMRMYHLSLPHLSFLRMLSASAIVYVMNLAWPAGSLPMDFVKWAVSVPVYVALLSLLGELRREDWLSLRNLLQARLSGARL